MNKEQKKLELERKLKYQNYQIREKDCLVFTSSSYHQPLLQKFVRNKLPKSKDSLMEYTRNHIVRYEVEDAEAVLNILNRIN